MESIGESGRRAAKALLRKVPNAVLSKTEAESTRRGYARYGSFDRFMPYTMVPEARLRALKQQVIDVVEGGVKGAFVECGVWRGGSAFVMASALLELGDPRPVWLFDSFKGLPPPAPIDGPAANKWARDLDSPGYYDNCAASLEEVLAGAAALGLKDRVRLVQGWFDQSLPAHREAIGPIAILRIDGDWYASVKACLGNLFEQVSPGGIVIFDDYDLWDGCTLAVHEYLAEHKLALGIRREGHPYVTKQ